MGYAFCDLLDDVAWWLVLGLVLSAIVEVALSANLFEIWGAGAATGVIPNVEMSDLSVQI